MPRIDDTPEEARIRAEIIERGLKGLSPGMVLKNPKTEIEPLVMDGLTDYEIGLKRGISSVSVCMLRKYHGLPNCLDVREMLACVQDEPDGPTIEEALTGEPIEDVETYTATEGGEVEPPEPEPQPLQPVENQPSLKQDIINLVMETFAPLSDRLKRECGEILDEAKKAVTQVEATVSAIAESAVELEPQEGELPLLSIEKPAQLAAPLVQGIAKYLDRMGDEMVEVIVTVRRV